MSQHDMDLANQAGAAFRSDANNALQALVTLSSGATAPATTFARMLWADTTSNQLRRRNAANSGWVVLCSLDEAFIISRSSNTILGESDRGKTLIATAGFTQTVTAAATLGDGWYIDVIVDSGATLVIDPNSTETIDGATTKSIVGPLQGRLVCNGTLFRTIGFAAAGAASDTLAGVIEIAVQSEMEAASSALLAVTPGRQQYHPSSAKGWCSAGVTGNINAAYNVTSVTDGGAGKATVNWTVVFTGSYAMMATALTASGTSLLTLINSATFSVSSSEINTITSTTGALTDPDAYSIAAFGDQA